MTSPAYSYHWFVSLAVVISGSLNDVRVIKGGITYFREVTCEQFGEQI